MWRVILLVLLVAGQLVIWGQAASARVIVPAGAITIRPVHTEKCFDIENSSASTGVPVKQYDCHGQSNQRFVFDFVRSSPDGDVYRIRSSASQKCLGLGRESTANNEPINQYECGNGWGQEFRFEQHGLQILGRVVHSNLAVGVLDSGTTNGARIVQQNYDPDNPAQRLTLQDRSTGSGQVLVHPAHSGKCLDVFGASKASGAQLKQYGCHGQANQRFTLQEYPTGTGFFLIRASHTGMCLEVWAAGTVNGTPVRQTPCHGLNHQRFVVQANAGYWLLRPAHDGMCLDIAGRSQNDGADLQQWNCANQSNQRFWFERL